MAGRFGKPGIIRSSFKKRKNDLRYLAETVGQSGTIGEATLIDEIDSGRTREHDGIVVISKKGKTLDGFYFVNNEDSSQLFVGSGGLNAPGQFTAREVKIDRYSREIKYNPGRDHND
tara:strand:+ start:292 stop:642 length:351 start_codon:yes stop_codon:yes gene_type:complete